jgi:hypothetical protein
MRKMILLILMMVVVFPVVSFAGSSSSSDSTSMGVGIAGASNETIFTSPNIPLQPQPIYPYLLQMLPGVVEDVTRFCPKNGLVDMLEPGDRYYKVKTYNGWFWDRIRLEDIEGEVLDRLPDAIKELGARNASDVRFKIRLKMSSRTIGSGGGGGGTLAGYGGGTNPLAYGSNASILPAIAVNTADPQFVISFYLVIPPSGKKASMEEQYKKSGWRQVEERVPLATKAGEPKKKVFGVEVSD